MIQNEPVAIPVSESTKVSGVLSVPDARPKDTGVIIAHGAGNDMNQPMLASLAEGLANAGYPALRFNFLYREMGKKVPDGQAQLYAAWQGAYRFLAEHPVCRPMHIMAAGKSLGGRIASQMAAEGMLAAEGLIFLGYPLHAPGRKERLQDGHLYKISRPMLFFAGSRDPLCDLHLLRQVLSKLNAPWELEVIEGGDHSFHLPKSHPMDPTEVYERIVSRTLDWLKMG